MFIKLIYNGLEVVSTLIRKQESLEKLKENIKSRLHGGEAEGTAKWTFQFYNEVAGDYMLHVGERVPCGSRGFPKSPKVIVEITDDGFVSPNLDPVIMKIPVSVYDIIK